MNVKENNFLNVGKRFLLIYLTAITLYASDIPYYLTNGFGTKTEAGLSGYVVRVTHLGNYGSGSLRYALEASYPRLVVFDVGGIIDLDMKNISIKNPYITVAGQTAPKPGITLIKGGISIGSHDVVVQHIAIRPGDAGQAKQSGWEPDGITTYGTDVYNVVLDHCSATWAVDENLSVSGPGDSEPMTSSHDITLYKCIIAEALANSSHSKGVHSMGTLLHDGVSNVSIIGCLYAHNNQRNPLFKGRSSAAFVNNVIYNSGAYAIQMVDYGTNSDVIIGQSSASVVGNVWIKGEDSSTRPFVRSSKNRASGKVYLEDNLLLNRSGITQDMTDGYLEVVDNPPVWPEGLSAVPSYTNIYNVLRSAGARALERDDIDARVVNSVINGTGRIMDSQDETGGYPVYDMTIRTLNVPEGVYKRRRWLDSLSSELDTDESLDTSPLDLLVTSVREENIQPDFRLYDNYPNPFNPSTTIEYTIPALTQPLSPREVVSGGRQIVKLIIYDILGQQVATLVDKPQKPGNYSVKFKAAFLPSGVYLYKLETGGFAESKKMILLR